MSAGPPALDQGRPSLLPLPVAQALLSGPQSRQLGLGIGRECLGEDAWAGEQVWWGAAGAG